MLSKKMAFSLTSLITILALSFVVSSAMAADEPFTVKIEGSTVGDLCPRCYIGRLTPGY